MVFSRKLSLRELFEAVELPQMEEPDDQEKPKRRGRPRYPDKPLLNALVIIPLGVASENGLAQKLAELPSLTEDCGFEGKTPSQPTLNRFKHRLGVEGFKLVFKGLVRKLIRSGVIHGTAVIIDATCLRAFRSDLDAEWGYRRFQG